MGILVRALRAVDKGLQLLDFLFVAVALLALVFIGLFTGLRWLTVAILAGDRVVIAVTAAVLGCLLAWPAVRGAA